MEGKLASILLLILLLVSTIVLAHNVQPVKSDYAWTETIYIRADGSIQPSTAPISSVDNVTYTLTDNITGNVPAFSSAISIQRDNITIDGADHTLKGTNASHSEGIYLSGRSNVTIKNMKITAFFYGIYLDSSSSNSVSGNNITANNGTGIYLYSSSNSNSVSGNNITANNGYGILLYYSPNNTVSGNNASANSLEGIYLSLSSNNTVSGNTAIANEAGIMLYSSSNNIISANNAMANVYQGIEVDSSSNNTLIGNNASTNSQYGILFDSSSNNTIYHNNFMNNTYQVSIYNSTDTWDNGYPSGGNYWSDYNGTDLHGGPHQNETGSDGIGDTPYSIDVENKDNYPLMQPWSPHYTRYSWPTFHHDESHSGYSESPAPGTNNKLWNYTTGNGVDSSPAVVGGRVYVGSGDYKVYCLDASTGAQVWNYTTGSAVYSSPAVADGRVYVGSDDYKVYCLDASTGAQVWNYTTGNYVGSSPAVSDGRVYVGSYDGRVYCLDASTGAQVWNYVTSGVVDSSPAVVGGRVYVGSYDGRVYCLDASTGAQVWNYTTGNYVGSSPAVVGGRVYVGSWDNRVYCLDASTGAQVWNYTTGSAVYSSPAVADGRVYVGSGDYKVYCLDASTGAQVWNYTTGNILASAPAVAGGRVCVSSYDGRVYCLDASTGAQVWNYTTGNYVFSSPAVADGVLYVGSGDGSVYAFGKVLRVPEDYATIQAAINAATPGATVWIAPGVYHESLVINKTITLIGKPGSEPIFNGGGSGIAITIVSSGSGSTIAGITITSWDQGILVDGANGCKIYDNIMSLINNNGVVLQGTGAVSNQVCGNMFEQDAVAIDVTSSSSSNVISQNIISLSSIGLRIETSGNTICENMISENQLGINIVNSNNNAIYHNNFMDNTIAFQLSNSTSPGNSWDNGYPSGGNYWSTWTGPDKNSGPDQNILGVSDGIVDTPYTVAVNNKDNYPLAKPFQLHNVGIATVTLGKTVVGRGYCCNITLIIVDYGLCGETFNMAIWVSQLRIDLQPVVLADRSSTEINFTWDTTGFLYGNYTVACVADVVPDETLTADNDYVFNVPVHVGVPGDVSGTTPGVYDGITNMKDIAYLVSVFNTKPSSPNWQPNADVNNDGLANMKDIAVAVYYFNQHE
ncbi:MAG: PQQ-binding-like beta-propeller repeat protein [Candidatus Bathyarchaeia archaeon]|jgi:parallel beta-helix repeat protein